MEFQIQVQETSEEGLSYLVWCDAEGWVMQGGIETMSI
jgi:hypothetical protein